MTTASAFAASLGGVVYEDADRNGVFDANERPLRSVRVQIVGRDGTVVRQTRSATDGSWLFTGLTDGDYVVSIDPRGFRQSLPNPVALPAPIPDFPFGSPRYSSFAGLVDRLRSTDSFLHIGLGDSIGFGFNFCGSLLGEDGYFEPTSARLGGTTAPTLFGDKQAIPGHETHHLLEPGISGDFPFTHNDVFYAVDDGADLVTISIGGNDFLGAEDGGDAEIAAALVIARRNLQEILSSLVSELPDAAIEINTVYDNEEGGDGLHNVWVPIWDQMLRETAWGQERPVRVAEIYPEYRHDADGTLLGEPGLICNDFLGLDGIHPTNSGYDVHEQKLWQSVGGVTLAGADRLDFEVGFLRPRRLLAPRAFEDLTGNTVNPADALTTDDVGALVPSDGAELRLERFILGTPGTLDLQHALLKVRYRTTGAPIDDIYRFEASVDGSYSPPGSTPTTWNTVLPIVGATGDGGSEILAYPDQPGFRTVSAPIYVDAPTSNDGTLAWSDLQTVSVRLVTTAVGAPDGFSVEWDSAWIETYTTMAGARPEHRSPPDTMPSQPSTPRPPLTTAELIDRLGAVPLSEAALDALAGRPEAAPELAELLRDGQLQTRAHAARVLGRLGVASPIVVRALRAALDDETPVRAEAISALAALDDRESANAISERRHDPDLAVRVARALGRLDAVSTLDDLLELARSRELSATARRWAARGLAGSRHAASAERLTALAESDDLRIRRLAAAGLARLARGAP